MIHEIIAAVVTQEDADWFARIFAEVFDVETSVMQRDNGTFWVTALLDGTLKQRRAMWKYLATAPNITAKLPR